MDQNLIALTFDETSKAYQAFSELKRAAAEQRVGLLNAAVVERGADGRFSIKDGASDASTGSQVVTGSLIGSLLGILGGPLGVLLGASTGAAVGSLGALENAGNRFSLIEQFMHSTPPGATMLVALVEETAPDVVDGLATRLDGHVLRRPVDAVQAEVDANEQARQAAADQARKVLREKQKDEWRERFDNWKDQFSDRLEALRKRIHDRRGPSA